MAITPSTFADKVIPVTVEWFDEQVEMGLRPGLWTQSKLYSLLELKTMEDRDESQREAAQAIADTIAYWDILGDDGERLPVSAELLLQFPMSFVNAIPEALGRALREQGKA